MISVRICNEDKFKDCLCDTVLVNTVSGIIGIKENHVNLVTKLVSGCIKMLNPEGQVIDNISIENGLLQFNNCNNTCIITVL